MAPTIDQIRTQEVLDWSSALVEDGSDRATRELVRHLGAVPDGDAVRFGCWFPQVVEIPGAHAELELLIACDQIDATRSLQQVRFQRYVLPMSATGEFAWAVVQGVPLGNRDDFGTFYRFWISGDGQPSRMVPDALGASFPFGAFGPAEVIDLADLDRRRPDADYYAAAGGDRDRDGIPRRYAPVNILQVHVATATAGGTLASLALAINETAGRIRRDEPLSLADELWMGYDAVELMPVEPTIEHESGPRFWEESADRGDSVEVKLRHSDMIGWGYDILISGGAAVNPAILESLRPHELADLAAALHDFPERPMSLILDVVYGHADNQVKGLLPDAWFTGPDMYGQHLDYRNPIVRAHLLEMQRRKANFGADGLRVDGAQDFTWWDPDEQQLRYDDRYMLEMSDVVQEVSGVEFRPWMIFEDGRPWPRDDWELASSYRAVTERQPHVVQWGPLTFAHNTPFLFTFWISKWWRLREVAEVGADWISGCANHDTLRRGSQVDPQERINTYLGDSLPETIARSYDHPAATLLFHAFLPGIPMDFLQATARAPWSFFRNSDARYATKVWGEEARFLSWRVTEDAYRQDGHFARLKALGFTDLSLLRSFTSELESAVALLGDDEGQVLARLQGAPRPAGFDLTPDGLAAGYRAWMSDIHDFCNVDRHLGDLDRVTVRFDLAVREFRRQRPWLRDNLSADDVFDYRHPTSGSVVFFGVRTAPDTSERVLLIVNMEGAPATVNPNELISSDHRWEPALWAPEVDPGGYPLTLTDGTGAVFTSRP
jgi:hypothetical protein